MTPFEAATHELAGAVAEILENVVGFDPEDIQRVSVVRVRLRNLVGALVIDQQYPQLPDAPASDVRACAAAIRARHADLRKGAGA